MLILEHTNITVPVVMIPARSRIGQFGVRINWIRYESLQMPLIHNLVFLNNYIVITVLAMIADPAVSTPVDDFDGGADSRNQYVAKPSVSR